MEQKQYEYRHLNDLEDESLSIVLSSCPYSLLACFEGKPEVMEKNARLLDGYKKRLVLEDFQQLDLEKLGVPRISVVEEIEAAQRTIIRAAKVLLMRATSTPRMKLSLKPHCSLAQQLLNELIFLNLTSRRSSVATHSDRWLTHDDLANSYYLNLTRSFAY